MTENNNTNLQIDLNNFTNEVRKAFDIFISTESYKRHSLANQVAIITNELSNIMTLMVVAWVRKNGIVPEIIDTLTAEPSSPEFDKIFRENMKDLLA